MGNAESSETSTEHLRGQLGEGSAQHDKPEHTAVMLTPAHHCCRMIDRKIRHIHISMLCICRCGRLLHHS